MMNQGRLRRKRWICITPFLRFSSMTFAGWTYDEVTDPFDDITRPTATLDNVIAWCEPKGGLLARYPVVVILTESIPEAHHEDVAFSIGPVVGFEYRFDKAKSQTGTVSVAEDYRGIRLCPGYGKMCAKGFLQRAYAGQKLIYRVDTVTDGYELGEVDLTEGKENLRMVMDACKIKPKKFKGVGTS